MRIVLYGFDDGDSAETCVYDRSGAEAVSIRAVREGNAIRLSVKGAAEPFAAESTQGLGIIVTE